MNTKDIKPLEGFDWEAYEHDGVKTTEMKEAEKAYESTLNKITDNEVVDGVVLSVEDAFVMVW